MDIVITVTGPSGQQIDNEWRVTQPGDLERALGEALQLYRDAYPDAAPFEQTIRVAHA